MKKKIVEVNKVILKGVVVGHFAMWAIRQSPYLLPRELEKGIEAFNEYLISSGKVGSEDFIETTYTELRDNIRSAITSSDIISSWNVAKKGTGNVFVSVYSSPKPDYDFIDLDALAGNIALSVWVELLCDDGGFK